MMKPKIGDMIETYVTNPIYKDIGIILYIDEGAFKAYFFASNQIEFFSTSLIRHGMFKVIS